MKLFRFACAVVVMLASAVQGADKKNVVLIAGKPSHGPGQHEHNAGVLLFKKCLEQGAAEAVTVRLPCPRRPWSAQSGFKQ